jgi:hypothetical protein
MAKMAKPGFGGRKRDLEEAFFGELDQHLLKALREETATKEKKKALSDASGITDEELLDHMVELNLCSETVAALSLVPLIFVGWADNKLDDKERAAIIQAAERTGLAKGHPGHDVLESWLTKKPGEKLLTAWKNYVAALTENLSEEDDKQLKEELLGRAREVAEASGGILGFGNKISKVEQAVLDELAQAF